MQSSVPAARGAAQVSVGSHLAFILGSALCMLLLFALARLGLLAYNQALIADTPASTFAESFVNGARFDLRLIVYLCIPLSLSLPWSAPIAWTPPSPRSTVTAPLAPP